MSEERLPELTKAVIPPQTHIKRLEERYAIGKSLREKSSRKAQAEFKPAPGRPDPVEMLIENSRGRLEDLIPIRYGRMMVSPFTFYRGAAAIMAYDLAHTPSTGMNLVADGDCHLMNFGAFATAERNIIFDLNDFDEASLAPWEWDVKRLAASFVIAGRSNGFTATDNREASWLAAQSYREKMAEYATLPILQAYNDAFDFEELVAGIQDKGMKRFYTKKLASATEQSAHEKEFAKLTFTGGDLPRIVDQPPLIYHFNDQRDVDMREYATKSIKAYRQSLIPSLRILLSRFEIVDYAVKVVGVGSVGTFCGIILLLSGNGDPLFLQFKEARKSVLEAYCGATPYRHNGQRVVFGQRTLQAASDIFLGWTTGAGALKRHFFIRQLSDAKIKPVIEIMKEPNLKGYARLCGRALARAHALRGCRCPHRLYGKVHRFRRRPGRLQRSVCRPERERSRRPAAGHPRWPGRGARHRVNARPAC
jgi:uncharacterized protein (DUF2252 family)